MQRYFGRIVENHVILGDDDIHHLTRVMRAKVGTQIEVVSDGIVYLSEVKRFKPLTIDVVHRIKENNELPNHIILIASLLKGDKNDLVLQKATELGANEVVFIHTERTVVKIRKEDREVKIARFNRILKEAAEQSKRTVLPSIYRILDFNSLKTVQADVKIIAYEGLEGPTAGFNKIISTIKPGQKVAILIGPEGGFSEEEVETAAKYGYKKVGLGKRILRAETASFYVLSVIGNLLERK